MRFINALAKFAHHWRSSGRANDRASLVPGEFFGATRAVLIGPPGRTVGKGFSKTHPVTVAIAVVVAVARGPPLDLQRRPSGKKMPQKNPEVRPALKSPGTVREFLKDIRYAPDIYIALGMTRDASDNVECTRISPASAPDS